CVAVMRPKLLDVIVSDAGVSRFSALNRFEKATSNRNADGAAIGTLFPMVIEKTPVPGPISVPTLQLPNRPMLLPGRTNALRSKSGSAVGFERLPSPTQSGRCVAVNPRTVAPVPDGSALLNDGVRNGPDCTRTTPATSQPPTSRSSPGPICDAPARPRPNGN